MQTESHLFDGWDLTVACVAGVGDTIAVASPERGNERTLLAPFVVASVDREQRTGGGRIYAVYTLAGDDGTVVEVESTHPVLLRRAAVVELRQVA